MARSKSVKSKPQTEEQTKTKIPEQDSGSSGTQDSTGTEKQTESSETEQASSGAATSDQFLNAGSSSGTQDSTGTEKQTESQENHISQEISEPKKNISSPQPSSGDPCSQKNCRGSLGIISRFSTKEKRTLYFACDICGESPKNNKRIIRLV